MTVVKRRKKARHNNAAAPLRTEAKNHNEYQAFYKRVLLSLIIICSTIGTFFYYRSSMISPSSTSTSYSPNYSLDFTLPISLETSSCEEQHYDHHSSQLIHITNATTMWSNENEIFLMLNGESVGMFFKIPSSITCLPSLIYSAATVLGAPPESLHEFQLYSQDGKPLISFKNTFAAHILLDSALWIWPGISIGHTHYLENNITLRTVSLRPLIYRIFNFSSTQEIQSILEAGTPSLQQAYLNFSTNDEHWFKDSDLTLKFRSRLANVARLPSVSFTETFRLNVYNAGQFNNLHTDYVSRDDLTRNRFQHDHEAPYITWATWVTNQIINLKESLPIEDIAPGNKWYPDPNDKVVFQNTILTSIVNRFDKILEEGNRHHHHHQYIVELLKMYLFKNPDGSDRKDGVDPPTGYLIEHMCQLFTDFWKLVIQEFEIHVSHDPRLRYTFPPHTPPSSHYFRWIRWLKQRHVECTPPPSYKKSFQQFMLSLLKDHHSKDHHSEDHHSRLDDLFTVLRENPSDVRLLPELYENHCHNSMKLKTYKFPKDPIQHFYPQRFVTLVLGLNDVEEGGETVFPYASPSSSKTTIIREGMPGCSSGLALESSYNTGLLFYSQLNNLAEDPESRHGGCPPVQGSIKKNINLFVWNVDATEAQDAYDMI